MRRTRADSLQQTVRHSHQCREAVWLSAAVAESRVVSSSTYRARTSPRRKQKTFRRSPTVCGPSRRRPPGDEGWCSLAPRTRATFFSHFRFRRAERSCCYNPFTAPPSSHHSREHETALHSSARSRHAERRAQLPRAEHTHAVRGCRCAAARARYATSERASVFRQSCAHASLTSSPRSDIPRLLRGENVHRCAQQAAMQQSWRRAAQSCVLSLLAQASHTSASASHG